MESTFPKCIIIQIFDNNNRAGAAAGGSLSSIPIGGLCTTLVYVQACDQLYGSCHALICHDLVDQLQYCGFMGFDLMSALNSIRHERLSIGKAVRDTRYLLQTAPLFCYTWLHSS